MGLDRIANFNAPFAFCQVVLLPIIGHLSGSEIKMLQKLKTMAGRGGEELANAMQLVFLSIQHILYYIHYHDLNWGLG